MASEIKFSTGEGTYSYDYALMLENMIDALYAHSNVLRYLRQKSIANFASDSDRFPKVPRLAAASIVDGDDLSNTPFNPSQVTLTVGEVGLMLTLTDLARTSQIVDAGHYGTEAGKAVAEKLTSDITALGAGFSNTVGSTTVDLTETNFLDAIVQLQSNNVPGPYFAVLHPQQWDDLIASVGSAISPAANTGGTARSEMSSFGANPDGAIGNIYNVDSVWNSTVPTANAGEDRAGMMAAAGRALGYVEKWAVRPELERDASLRATEIVVTACYAVGELDDISGVGIVTDA